MKEFNGLWCELLQTEFYAVHLYRYCESWILSLPSYIMNSCCEQLEIGIWQHCVTLVVLFSHM